MGEKRVKAIQIGCSRLFRGEIDEPLQRHLLGKLIDDEMEEEGIRETEPIPWLRCPRCRGPMKRSKLGWTVACFTSSGGCGWKPP